MSHVPPQPPAHSRDTGAAGARMHETQPISTPPADAPPPPPPPRPSALGHGEPAVAHPPEPSSGSGRTLLHILAAVLVVAGISLPLDGSGVLWADSAAWAAFAVVAAVAQIAAVGSRGSMDGRAWWIGAAGAGGLLLFWTLLMLPAISTNMAFLVTLGTAAAVYGVMTSPDRRI